MGIGVRRRELPLLLLLPERNGRRHCVNRTDRPHTDHPIRITRR